MTAASDLGGLRVVVTRATEQAEGLVRAIRDAGGRPIALPLLEIVDPPDGGAHLRRAVDSLTSRDWLAVLSANGAVRVVDSGVGPRRCRLAVVADATAAVFREMGWAPDLVPEIATSQGLVDAFPRPDGGRVVIAQASSGLSTLADGLAAAGWPVEVVVAYDNSLPALDSVAVEEAKESDVVVFASPSAAERYRAHVGRRPSLAVCFGPTTADAARDVGFDVRTAASPSVDAVVSELLRLVQR